MKLRWVVYCGIYASDTISKKKWKKIIKKTKNSYFITSVNDYKSEGMANWGEVNCISFVKYKFRSETILEESIFYNL